MKNVWTFLILFFVASKGIATEKIYLQCESKKAALKVYFSETENGIRLERQVRDAGLLLKDPTFVVTGNSNEISSVVLAPATAEKKNGVLTIQTQDAAASKILITLNPAPQAAGESVIIKILTSRGDLAEAISKGLGLVTADDLSFFSSQCKN